MAKEKALRKTSGSALEVLKGKLVKEAGGFNPVPVVISIIHPAQLFDTGVAQEKRLVGVILASKMLRIFYPRFSNEKDTEAILEFTNKRPFCSSSDFKLGRLVELTESDWANAPETAVMLKEKIAEGAGRCINCPLKEWESESILRDEARGTACKELRRLLFWKEGLTIPCILSIPSTSVRNLDSYLSGLLAGGLAGYEVITEISLEPASRGERKWSTVVFSKAGELTEDMAQELIHPVTVKGESVPLFEALVAIFNQREVSIDEYPDNGTTEGSDDF